MAKTPQERSAKNAKKRVANAEEELSKGSPRHPPGPG